MKMAKTIFTKNPVKFIPALAEALKKVPEFEIPEWANYVKTGVSRERPPVDDDFWYTRAASILRQLYIKGVVGVEKLRTRYGSKKDRGGRPDKFKKAGGKIIRVILQQAEAAGLVEKVLRMQYGRRLTQEGRDFLDSIDVPTELAVDSEQWTVENTPQDGSQLKTADGSDSESQDGSSQNDGGSVAPEELDSEKLSSAGDEVSDTEVKDEVNEDGE